MLKAWSREQGARKFGSEVSPYALIAALIQTVFAAYFID